MKARLVMPVVQATWAVALALASLGCHQNQCSPNQSRCASSTTWTECVYGGGGDTPSLGSGYDWAPSTPCTGGPYCVDVDGGFQCSLTPSAIPECSTEGYACWQDMVVVCTNGLPTYPTGPGGLVLPATQCLTDAGQTCSVTADRSCGYCLPAGAAPVVGTTCGSGSTTCVGNAIYSCSCGLAISEISDCGDSGVCLPGVAQCVLSSAPDPRCVNTGSYCLPGMVVTCTPPGCADCAGYDVQVAPCETCAPGGAFCAADAGAE